MTAFSLILIFLIQVTRLVAACHQLDPEAQAMHYAIPKAHRGESVWASLSPSVLLVSRTESTQVGSTVGLRLVYLFSRLQETDTRCETVWKGTCQLSGTC